MSASNSNNKPSRTIKPPRRPLDDDFEWDSLGPLSADIARLSSDLANFSRSPSTAFTTLPTSIAQGADQLPSAGISSSASPTHTLQQTDGVSPNPARDASRNDTTTTPVQDLRAAHDAELRRLLVVKESQQLEVQKLQLQLELARIQAITTPAVNEASTKFHERQDNTKSLGDLRAPQRTLFPQQWPHILAPGEPKLYNELTIAEFTSGYLAIVEQTRDSSKKSLLLSHLADLMGLACSYQWSAVRAFHYKVLRALEMGLVKWGVSFEPYKQPFFIPPNLLPSVGINTPDKARKPASGRPQGTQQPLRHQICDDWSWHDDCKSDDCPKLHVCVVCKRSDHQAKHCPKRKFDIPTRRQDPSPKAS